MNRIERPTMQSAQSFYFSPSDAFFLTLSCYLIMHKHIRIVCVTKKAFLKWSIAG